METGPKIFISGIVYKPDGKTAAALVLLSIFIIPTRRVIIPINTKGKALQPGMDI